MSFSHPNLPVTPSHSVRCCFLYIFPDILREVRIFPLPIFYEKRTYYIYLILYLAACPGYSLATMPCQHIKSFFMPPLPRTLYPNVYDPTLSDGIVVGRL